jgi:hypothetical protein
MNVRFIVFTLPIAKCEKKENWIHTSLFMFFLIFFFSSKQEQKKRKKCTSFPLWFSSLAPSPCTSSKRGRTTGSFPSSERPFPFITWEAKVVTTPPRGELSQSSPQRRPLLRVRGKLFIASNHTHFYSHPPMRRLWCWNKTLPALIPLFDTFLMISPLEQNCA